MSPENPLRLLLAVFLAGIQVSPTLPKKVTVTEGEMAVLHFDFSASTVGRSTKEDLWISCKKYNEIHPHGIPVCDFHEGKSYAQNGGINRAEITRLHDTSHLYSLTIFPTTFPDQGEYLCEVSRGSTADRVTVQLDILGRVENRELPEGSELSIDLPLSSCYIEFYGKQQNVTVCRVENGQVIEAAEEYTQRLSMRNGTLILGKLTAKDHGNYTVWDKSGKRVILTITVEIKTKPLGVQTTGRVENRELPEGSELSIDLPLSSCYIEFYGKQQNLTVCRVENGQVIEAAEEYPQRLSMRNGTLILGKLTAKDHGNYTVWDKSGKRVILTLAVEIKTKPLGVQTTGRVENRELHEGANLSIDLPLSSCYIEFYGKQQSVIVCRVENGQVIEAAEEYHQRLSMQNGTLILSNLTAKDHGNYTVWDHSGERAILNLTVKIKIIPFGGQSIEPWIIILVVFGGLLLLDGIIIIVGSGIYMWHARRKMEKDSVKQVEAVEMGSLNKSNSPAETGGNNELRLTLPLHDKGPMKGANLEVKGCAANQKWNGKNDRDCY